MRASKQAPAVNYLAKILELFLHECGQRDLQVERDFAQFFLRLLAQDGRDGLTPAAFLSECKWRRFLEVALEKYANCLDPTACNMKLVYLMKHVAVYLNPQNVRTKYVEKFKEKLQRLTNEILQYPETSSDLQLEQMFHKMQVYIVARYNLGCPNNHVLLKQIGQSLNSVIGHSDLQNYVLKKRYHRLEYLERLVATVGGILIYNNQNPTGEKEQMRNVSDDLDMALQNTKVNLEKASKRAQKLKQYGYDIMQQIIQLDVDTKQLHCLWPIEKIREINKFLVLFNVYDGHLRDIMEIFEKTEYRIGLTKCKLKCVVEKINDVLKGRSAIESELIFPHFVHLSEVWSETILYLNYLAELNRIRDQMDVILSEKLEMHFVLTCENIMECSKQKASPIHYTFDRFIEQANKRQVDGNFLHVHNRINEYCAGTIALTNGLLVPAQLEKKLCENLKLKFGFSNIKISKYAERYFEEFLHTYRNVIFTSVDLILLLKLEDHLEQEEKKLKGMQLTKTNSIETQTEMQLESDHSPASLMKATWNVWDFHRETIRMANLRRHQTHSTQSTLSYGQRDAQNECNYTRKHF